MIADTVKPTSAEAIRQFKRLGLTPVLLTGDNENVANRIAGELGLRTSSPRCCPPTRSP